MPKDDDTKASAIRKRVGDRDFLLALTSGLPLQPNGDFAKLLRRLDIAEVEYNRLKHQFNGGLEPPS